MRRPRISELFLPLYIGLLLIWPAVWSGERFLLPALPFILFYAGDALVRLLRMTAPPAARLVPAAVAGVLVLMGIPQLSQATQLSSECMALYRAGDRYACWSQPWKDYAAIAEVVPRALPDKSAILSRKPRTFYVISGVPGQVFPLNPAPDSFFKAVRETGARYVLFDGIDALAQAYVAPVLMSRSNSFCIMFGLGQDRATLFGIRPAMAPPPSTPNFELCGPEFWRSAAIRDSVLNGN